MLSSSGLTISAANLETDHFWPNWMHHNAPSNPWYTDPHPIGKNRTIIRARMHSRKMRRAPMVQQFFPLYPARWHPAPARWPSIPPSSSRKRGFHAYTKPRSRPCNSASADRVVRFMPKAAWLWRWCQPWRQFEQRWVKEGFLSRRCGPDTSAQANRERSDEASGWARRRYRGRDDWRPNRGWREIGTQWRIDERWLGWELLRL